MFVQRTPAGSRTRALVLLATSSAACGGLTAIAGDGSSGGDSSSSNAQADDTSATANNSYTTTSEPGDSGLTSVETGGTSAGDPTADSSGTTTHSSETSSTDPVQIDTSSSSGDKGSDAESTTQDNGGSTSGEACCEESSSSTGEPPGPPFVEITALAGMDHHQGTPATVPNCLIDAVNPPIAGLFCSPERYAGGAAVADVDVDGLLDVFITRPYEQDLLYRNQGDGTFVDIATEVGLIGTLGTSGAAFGDVDNDGDQDLYVTTLGQFQHYLFIQEDGMFTEQALERDAGILTEYQHAGSTPAFADYDLDGDLDIFVGEWRTHAVGTHPSHNRLLRNLGPDDLGQFEDVTIAAGIALDDVWESVDGNIAGTFVLSVGWGDLDSDGYPDLMLASDFDASRLFWNEGDGTFIDGTMDAGVGTDENGMGSASADYDRDGDFDWFVSSITADNKTGNRLYRNEGDRVFSDATDEAGVRDCGWGWGAAFFDHDLDADLDLVCTNGWYATANLEDPLVAWTNTDGSYVAEQDLLGLVDTGQGRALVAFDADNDGDLEVLVVNNRDEVRLFRNDTPTPDRHWLRVQAPGSASNRNGIGAVVTVELPGGRQRAQIGGTSHYLGHGPREAHFGLGEIATIGVRVDWPATGAFVELDDVEADQVLVVPEP